MVSPSIAQVKNTSRVKVEPVEPLHHHAVDQVKFEGFLGERLHDCIEHSVIEADVDNYVEQFETRTEHRWWQTEFWGKWMLSAVKAYEYAPSEKLMEIMSTSVDGIIATQTPDGYIGNYAPEHELNAWDVWGRKYTLLGLLYYYDLTGEAKALAAAKRLADYTMGQLGEGPNKERIVITGNYRGMASSSILEPIVLLYERTAEQRYLDFAKYIVADWETPQGPRLISKALAGVPVSERFTNYTRWWTWSNGQKAYEMMSCYDGLLRLYQLTGESEYLEAVEKTVANIIEDEINIAGSGASKECWFGGKHKQMYPAAHTMEVCATVYWMKLCYELHRLNHDAGLVDQIEKSAYNNLLGSLMPKGHRFAKYSALQGFRDPDGFQCNMHTNCCMANGPRGLTILQDLAVMKRGDGLVVNLYNPGNARVELSSGQTIEFRFDTRYPADGEIVVNVETSRPRTFPLHLRVPGWSDGMRVQVNGASTPVSGKPGGYVKLERQWESGDEIRIEMEMPVKVHRLSDAYREFAAFTRGPLTLAADSRINPMGVDFELYEIDSDPSFELAEESGEASYLAGPVDVSYGSGEGHQSMKLHLMDFVSAGDAWDVSNRYRVWFPLVYDPSVR